MRKRQAAIANWWYWAVIVTLSAATVARAASLSRNLNFAPPPGWVRQPAPLAGPTIGESWLKPKGLKGFGQPLSVIVLSPTRPGWTIDDFVKRASRRMNNVRRGTITLCNKTLAAYLTGTRTLEAPTFSSRAAYLAGRTTIRQTVFTVEAVFLSYRRNNYTVEYSRPQSDPRDEAAEAALRGLCPKS